MEDRYVDQLMSRPVETVRPATSIYRAAEKLIEDDIGAVVVVDDSNRVEGLLTATDFVRIVRDGVSLEDSTVEEFMRTDVVTTEPSAPASEVVETMLEHLIHHVPVVDDGEAVGMVTTLDCTAWLARSI